MACSSAINPASMSETAFEKGINVVGTGDVLHPAWFKELESALEPEDNGLYKLKGSNANVHFIASVEVSSIFEGRDKSVKKIHNCILLPSMESAGALSKELEKYGSMTADGRPQLQISAAELVDIVKGIESKAFIFPAHLWTPYFGALGAMSGFDSIKEAYEDREKDIHAYESGLSSDPKMNWRISELDKYALISNSDMHSLPNMGRESNIFELSELSYDSIIKAIVDKDSKRFKQTVEYYPEEGKYHYDGHRECGYSVNPEESKSTVCKVCGKKLVIGVLHRVDDLADRPAGYIPKDHIPYIHSVPLIEVISYAKKKTRYSPVVRELYSKLIGRFGDELDILTNVKIVDIEEIAGSEIAECIDNVRNDKIVIKPGYSGVYGELDLLGRKAHEMPKATKQKSMSDFFSRQ
ncbi:MAG: endonuclease Q family protein [Candidatus Marsarchaeota archaeon]|nr:endonuclease Q family protein [Candidatus Marsarchaeota archaeon]